MRALASPNAADRRRLRRGRSRWRSFGVSFVGSTKLRLGHEEGRTNRPAAEYSMATAGTWSDGGGGSVRTWERARGAAVVAIVGALAVGITAAAGGLDTPGTWAAYGAVVGALGGFLAVP